MNLKMIKQNFNKTKKVVSLEPDDSSPGPAKYKIPTFFSDKSFKFSKRVSNN